MKQTYKDGGFLFTLQNIRHQMAEKMADVRARYYSCERSFNIKQSEFHFKVLHADANDI